MNQKSREIRAQLIYTNLNNMLEYLGNLDQNTNAERITTTMALDFLPLIKDLLDNMTFITTMENYRDQVLEDYELDLGVGSELCNWKTKLF